METFKKITKTDIIRNIEYLNQLVFEVTDACNLRCVYCGYSQLYEGYDKRENLKFPFHRAKLIIDYLYYHWKEVASNPHVLKPVNVSFYGGEPLLNMAFIKKVMAYIENLPPVGKLFRYSMTTNAMLLDRYMDFLVEKDVHLLISLDGNEEGQSLRIDTRGGNSFSKVYSNVRLLQNKYPDYFDKNVNFNSVIHCKNSVDTTYKFIKEQFGKVPRLAALNDVGIRKDKHDSFWRIYKNIYENIKQSPCSEWLQKELFVNNPDTGNIAEYINKYSGNVFDSYSELLFDKKRISYPSTGTCIPFSKKMFITVKGRILQCEKIDHQYTLGYVTDEGVEIDIEKIVDSHNEYISKYQAQCKKCALIQNCPQCMFQLDDLSGKNRACNFFILPKELGRRLPERIKYLNSCPELYDRILKEVMYKG